ncbi:MAG TPA: hypothetical protein EYH02_03980 [Ignisphaera aggregans]|uniref:Uncharacterized protein n=1 Tax=Ignisphaera aggregans TaxID=334771 RepID=A0A832YZX1_9CREN|nr:hypothetical protein [Ignisphaera aggregans]
MTLIIREEQQNSAYVFTSMFEDAVIGGIRGKSLTSRTVLPQYPIKKAYLLLALSLTVPFNPMYKWKIVLDEVVLTREYKPMIETEVENSIKSLFVYDVTSAIKGFEPILKIVYDGRNPIRVDIAGLLTLHEYPRFHTYLEGYARIESLVKQPSFSYGVPSNFTPNEGRVLLAVTAVKRDTVRVLDKNTNSVFNYTLSPGINLIEMNLGNPATRTIEISAESTSSVHLFSILAYSHALYPQIKVEKLYVDGNALHLVLKNIAEEPSDDTMIILLRLGSVITQHRIGAVKGGETIELSIPIGGRHIPSIVRVVWRKATRTFVNDIKLQS